ncbi:MAG: L-lysine 6-transaminase [Bifidobacteriaceae bacterium]|jgi:L-lysine 6-transaminase|nr:L-lysine 6-transaminase [Bifidobacteriaceae bacterium]
MTQLLRPPLTAADVHPALSAAMLADGFGLVADLAASQGSRLVDALTGEAYLDLFSFFASGALGLNHPALTDPAAMAELGRAAVHKPSNSDVYTVAMAEFVVTFQRVAGDPRLGRHFFIEGGAPAVENALKTAFDFKSRLNESQGRSPDLGAQILHLTDAFHGRTGYTMSLTNTDPVKTARYPKFAWPRVTSPYLGTRRDGTPRDAEALERQALAEAEAAFAAHPHDIAAFIAEPIQCEGGDHHLSGRFLRQMQDLAHANESLFIVDEVQTGLGMTGTMWAYQQLGLEPDIVAFGKKSQVCGIMAGGLVEAVADNVFQVRSRLNSTWGGDLTDMVRARRILEVIESDHLVERAADLGQWFGEALSDLAERHPLATDPRGRGLLRAVSLPSPEIRAEAIRRLWDRRVVIAGCGDRTIRFRPALTVTRDDLAEGLDHLDAVLAELERA